MVTKRTRPAVALDGLGDDFDLGLGDVAAHANTSIEANPQSDPGGNGRPIRVLVDLIDEDPDNARRTYDEAEMLELAQSVEAHGVLEPLLVVQLDGGRYLVKSGHRRLRAARAAALATVPVWVVPGLSAIRAVVVNIQRADLPPMDLAVALKNVMLSQNLLAKDLAEQLGRSKAWVSKYMTLADQSLESRELLSTIDTKDTDLLADIARLYAKSPEMVRKALEEGRISNRASIAALQSQGSGDAQVAPGTPKHKKALTASRKPAPRTNAQLITKHEGDKWVIRTDLPASADMLPCHPLDDESGVKELRLPIKIVSVRRT